MWLEVTGREVKRWTGCFTRCWMWNSGFRDEEYSVNEVWERVWFTVGVLRKKKAEKKRVRENEREWQKETCTGWTKKTISHIDNKATDRQFWRHQKNKLANQKEILMKGFAKGLKWIWALGVLRIKWCFVVGLVERDSEETDKLKDEDS